MTACAFQRRMIPAALLVIAVLLFTIPSAHAAEMRPDLNGQLLQRPGEGAVYWIDQGKRRVILSMKIFQNLFVQSRIREYVDLGRVAEGPPVNDKVRLVKAGNNRAVFLMDQCRKRPVPSERMAKKYSLNLGKVVTVPAFVLDCVFKGKSLN